MSRGRSSVIINTAKSLNHKQKDPPLNVYSTRPTLLLSVKQIIEYYGARRKIEAGFKEIKQKIGSARSQTRDAQAVTNHLQFCMMATSLTWIYADRLPYTPSRRHQVQGRSGFFFSDVRRLIAEAALNQDFWALLPKAEQQPQNSFIHTLLRMVA